MRGGKHDVDEAASLFHEHLVCRQEYGLDACRARLTEESKSKGGDKFFRNFVQTDLRHGRLIRQHFPVSAILFFFALFFFSASQSLLWLLLCHVVVMFSSLPLTRVLFLFLLTNRYIMMRASPDVVIQFKLSGTVKPVKCGGG